MRGLGANCCGNGGASASPDAHSLHRFPNLTLKGLPGASFSIRQRCSHRATTHWHTRAPTKIRELRRQRNPCTPFQIP